MLYPSCAVLELRYICLGNSCKTYLDKLLKLQKRVVRNLYTTSVTHSSIPLLRDLRILNVYNMHKLELGVFNVQIFY